MKFNYRTDKELSWLSDVGGIGAQMAGFSVEFSTPIINLILLLSNLSSLWRRV